MDTYYTGLKAKKKPGKMGFKKAGKERKSPEEEHNNSTCKDSGQPCHRQGYPECLHVMSGKTPLFKKKARGDGKHQTKDKHSHYVDTDHGVSLSTRALLWRTPAT